MTTALKAAAERRLADAYTDDPDIGCSQRDLDNETLADAWLAEHPADAPDWYSSPEIREWLMRLHYSGEIASELAPTIATNYQLAFNKGFEMSKRTTLQEPKS